MSAKILVRDGKGRFSSIQTYKRGEAHPVGQGPTIAETVREAQELQAELGNQGVWSKIFAHFDPRYDGRTGNPHFALENKFRPIQYPKSLGEICIEVAQEACAAMTLGLPAPRCVMRPTLYQDITLSMDYHDVRALRTALYHRHQNFIYSIDSDYPPTGENCEIG
jgi:hypothetical protein